MEFSNRRSIVPPSRAHYSPRRIILAAEGVADGDKSRVKYEGLRGR